MNRLYWKKVYRNCGVTLMAKVKKNAMLEGLSGRLGNLVFKQYDGQTVVCKWPEHDPNRTPTPGEARQRDRIKAAAVKAKEILSTEAGQAYYQAACKQLGKHSAYHTAVYDYFGEPEIMAVNLDADQNLMIQVLDNVGVRAVRVEWGGETRFAEPLEETPCHLWRLPLGNGEATPDMVISAEDWMGNVGVRRV